jgi:hypothetical protein
VDAVLLAAPQNTALTESHKTSRQQQHTQSLQSIQPRIHNNNPAQAVWERRTKSLAEDKPMTNQTNSSQAQPFRRAQAAKNGHNNNSMDHNQPAPSPGHHRGLRRLPTTAHKHKNTVTQVAPMRNHSWTLPRTDEWETTLTTTPGPAISNFKRAEQEHAVEAPGKRRTSFHP